MSMFTLAISYLTTSNLPWFMDLTFQVPIQYCSLQHQTLLPSPTTSTTGYWFCFGSVFSFFLELFLYSSPVAYSTPTDLGSSFFSVISFCLFILFMGFLSQEYQSGLPIPSPVDHALSDLSTMTRLSWVAPWAWVSFIELDSEISASALPVNIQCWFPLELTTAKRDMNVILIEQLFTHISFTLVISGMSGDVICSLLQVCNYGLMSWLEAWGCCSLLGKVA